MLRHIGIRVARVGRSALARDGELTVTLHRAQARSYRACVCLGLAASTLASIQIDRVHIQRPPHLQRADAATHGKRRGRSFGRSALARDRALLGTLHRAQARSYRACVCLRAGVSTTDAINDQCTFSGRMLRDMGTRSGSSFGRSALARDGALPVTLHRAQARSYQARVRLQSGASTPASIQIDRVHIQRPAHPARLR
ncbi:hypothetical protein GGR70_001170 [Xanthomonas campestris]|nr:hypothetical protein [Xanthomonas campestris]